MGKEDYLPVQTNKKRRSSSQNFSTNKISGYTDDCFKVLPLCVLLTAVLACVLFLYFLHQLSSFEHLHSQVDELKGIVKNLEDEVAIVRNKVNLVPAKIDNIKDSIPKIPEVFDDSLVSFVVFENMEQFYKSYNQRWVASCDWDNCRQQSFPQVVRSVVKTRGTRDKVEILQIGFCSANIFTEGNINGTSISLTVLDDFKQDSPASMASCRGQANSHFRKKKEMDQEISKLSNLDFINLVRKKIDQTSIEAIGSMFDIVVLDLVGDELMSDIAMLLGSTFDKVKVGGSLIGHAYGVLTPYKRTSSSENLEFPVHWASGDTSKIDFSVASDLILATKAAVDKFVLKARESVTSTSGVVTVAGDTSWILEKRQTTLKDLFGSGGG